MEQLEKVSYLHIFEGQLLEDYLYCKEFLKKEIERYTKQRILKTRVLYRYDTKNTINFHHYIDGHDNLVAIVRTALGFMLAAFSESCVRAKHPATKGGLLFSLSNSKVFELIPNAKSVTYD